MKEIKKEIKTYETVWEATDGTIFNNYSECEKYEQTFEGVIKTRFNQLVLKKLSEYNLYDTGSEEYTIYFVKVNCESDVNDVLMLLQLSGHTEEHMCNYKCILENAVTNETVLMIGCSDYDNYYSLIGSRDEIFNNLRKEFYFDATC